MNLISTVYCNANYVPSGNKNCALLQLNFMRILNFPVFIVGSCTACVGVYAAKSTNRMQQKSVYVGETEKTCKITAFNIYQPARLELGCVQGSTSGYEESVCPLAAKEVSLVCVESRSLGVEQQKHFQCSSGTTYLFCCIPSRSHKQVTWSCTYGSRSY